MFKELGSIASMLKQAKTMGPKMQAQMEEVAKQRVSGTAGGGMITVEATGASEIVSVKIDPVLAEKNDLEMITDLLPAAINDARWAKPNNCTWKQWLQLPKTCRCPMAWKAC